MEPCEKICTLEFREPLTSSGSDLSKLANLQRERRNPCQVVTCRAVIIRNIRVDAGDIGIKRVSYNEYELGKPHPLILDSNYKIFSTTRMCKCCRMFQSLPQMQSTLFYCQQGSRPTARTSAPTFYWGAGRSTHYQAEHRQKKLEHSRSSGRYVDMIQLSVSKTKVTAHPYNRTIGRNQETSYTYGTL